MAALVCAAGANAQRKAALYDSTQVEALNEIVVKVSGHRKMHHLQ